MYVYIVSCNGHQSPLHGFPIGANGKNNQALARGDNESYEITVEVMIRSTSLRMTSAFSLPTCKTSSCDTVGVGGRSDTIPAS